MTAKGTLDTTGDSNLAGISVTGSHSEMDQAPASQLSEKPRSNDQLDSSGEDQVDPDDYPSGLRLVLLVSAVMLVVFLSSLDQVRQQHTLVLHICLLKLTLRETIRPLSAQPYPRSPTSFMVSAKCPGTARPTLCVWAASNLHGARPTDTST